MFIEAETFPFLSNIRSQWQVILDELSALSQSYFVEWPERDIYDGNWTVFALYFAGEPIQEHTVLCQQTNQLLTKVPGLVNAGFSSLAPGVHILPHEGYTKELLRCHVGLTTPANCGIRVGDEVRQWTPGSCLVFDDTQKHEAWNDSESTRVVLLFDFQRDPDAPMPKLPDEVYNYDLVDR